MNRQELENRTHLTKIEIMRSDMKKAETNKNYTLRMNTYFFKDESVIDRVKRTGDCGGDFYCRDCLLEKKIFCIY